MSSRGRKQDQRGLFCVAALWRPMPDHSGEAFTILNDQIRLRRSTDPQCQVVLLDRYDWLSWLDLTRPEGELLRPLPATTSFVEQVR